VILFERDSWKQHRTCAFTCGLLALAGLIWYGVSCLMAGRFLGATSLPGLTCGIAAFGLILYECSLFLRNSKGKRLALHRRPALTRLRWHVWLGLLSLPLALIHGGMFGRGGTLAQVLLGVYLAVILSGVVGLALQHWLPRRLLQHIPDETIPSEIAKLADELAGEAELLVLAVCGPPKQPEASPLTANINRVRAHRHAAGTGLLEDLPAEPITDTEMLRQYFESTIAPFLRQGAAVRSKLAAPRQAEEEFLDLRGRVNPDAHCFVNLLEKLCSRRRQFDQQVWIAFCLDAWVAVHLSLTAVLFLLLLWHVVTAVIYW
jgi:hypothetical protein